MTPTHNVETKVGIFIFIGIVLLCTSIMLLGGDKVFFTSYYKLNAKFDQVQGLQNGSVVSLEGIPVGNITKIEFLSQEGKIGVEVKVSKEYKKMITNETEASIRTQGALGDKYIYLTAGKMTEQPLEPGAQIKVSSEGDFLSSLSENSDGIDNTFALIKELKELITSLNAGNNPNKILTNVASATDNINDILENKKIKNSVDHLESILKKIDNGQGTLGALINDPTVHNQIKNFLGGSQRSQYIKGMLRKTIEDK